MPKILYKNKKFGPEALRLIRIAEQICTDYADQGYDITLRQLYYQFVARGHIANKQSEYKRLGTIVNDARMAGLIDWEHVVDRTRNPEHPSVWRDPAHIVQIVAEQFAINKWKTQPNYVEVWVEKEALAGVIERIGAELQVTTLACRGYMSQSEQWAAAQRLGKAIQRGQQPYIIHLGDHDPSGIDMTRDNDDRLGLFALTDAYRSLTNKPETLTLGTIRGAMREQWGAAEPIIKRIALNMDQIEQYQPPPNPAKMTDARFQGYADIYGEESWELDALPPDVLTDLVRDNVLDLRDDDLWDEEQGREDEMTEELAWVHANWTRVAAMSREEDS